MIGCSVGPYRLLAALGSGGMGEVWLAERDGVHVALKLLHWHFLEKPAYVQRFLREGEIGRGIRHPNLPATLDVGTAAFGGQDVHYIALEYLEGRTLRSLLRELGRVPEAYCRHLSVEVARALGAVHAAGAIHRDVKPENVLVTTDHAVKLTDLGVARPCSDDDRLSTLGSFVGTIEYCAPEQLVTRDLDGRADLYALGILMYEAAAGRHPLADLDLAARAAPPRAPRLGATCPQVSAFLEEVVDTLLAGDRADRFPSARELIGVLETGEASVWWGHRARTIEERTREPIRDARIVRDPPIAEESLVSLVADLADEDRGLLQVASCAGAEFDPALTGAVLGLPQAALLERLARIEKRTGLVRAVGPRFAFDSAVVRERIRATMPAALCRATEAALADPARIAAASTTKTGGARRKTNPSSLT